MTQQVTITCPTKTNDGQSNALVIRCIQQALAKQYGGYSAVAASGGWYDAQTGQYYADESVNVFTFVDDSQVDELLSSAACWASDLQQIELLVTVLPVTTHFIKGNRDRVAA